MTSTGEFEVVYNNFRIKKLVIVFLKWFVTGGYGLEQRGRGRDSMRIPSPGLGCSTPRRTAHPRRLWPSRRRRLRTRRHGLQVHRHGAKSIRTVVAQAPPSAEPSRGACARTRGRTPALDCPYHRRRAPRPVAAATPRNGTTSCRVRHGAFDRDKQATLPESGMTKMRRMTAPLDETGYHTAPEGAGSRDRNEGITGNCLGLRRLGVRFPRVSRAGERARGAAM